LLYVILIGLSLVIAIIYKIDENIKNEDIPHWVDKTMYKSIKEKQHTPYYLKIMHIYANAFLEEKNYLNWKDAEQYMDILIERIRQTGIHFDAVVGIKTGGAILSDYISQKLNLPNYKIKIAKNEYNCNKKPNDVFSDVYNKRILHEYGDYDICEGIKANLEGKNIILLDEMVSSGKTMYKSIQYLKNEKHSNIVYPLAISFTPFNISNADFYGIKK
jgi:hypoxanthine phosphoribosyltransferase